MSYLHVSIVAAFDGSFAERVQACEVTEQAQSFLALFRHVLCLHVCFFPEFLFFFFFKCRAILLACTGDGICLFICSKHTSFVDC